jgi:hypothetical protein
MKHLTLALAALALAAAAALQPPPAAAHVVDKEVTCVENNAAGDGRWRLGGARDRRHRDEKPGGGAEGRGGDSGRPAPVGPGPPGPEVMRGGGAHGSRAGGELLGIGAVTLFLTGRLCMSEEGDVPGSDAAVVTAVALLLLAVAGLASVLPAVRAAPRDLGAVLRDR